MPAALASAFSDMGMRAPVLLLFAVLDILSKHALLKVDLFPTRLIGSQRKTVIATTSTVAQTMAELTWDDVLAYDNLCKSNRSKGMARYLTLEEVRVYMEYTYVSSPYSNR